jgi:hypothetical protein
MLLVHKNDREKRCQDGKQKRVSGGCGREASQELE